MARDGARLRIVAHNGARIWGGGEIATCRILAALADRGHDIHLFCNDERVAARAASFGYPVGVAELGGDAVLTDALRFARVLRGLAPDALLIGTFRKLFLAGLAGRLARVPRVVTRIGLSTDVPRNAKYRFVFRNFIDAVALNAEAQRPSFLAALPSCDGSRVVTIHQGVEPPARRLPDGEVRRALGIGEAVAVVGAVARLDVQKRFDRLLRALAALPDGVHCVLAGDGAQRLMLERLARELGVDSRVHFLGWREDVGDVLAALDVFVVCSDREGMANAMLEAMAVGVPVVSTPVSGAAEALGPDPDGVSPGVLVDREGEGLAAALEALLEDPGRRRAMGEAGRRRAAEWFGVERMAERWEAFLRGDVAAAGSAGVERARRQAGRAAERAGDRT